MSEHVSQSREQPSAQPEERDRMNLQCIGSFKAYTQEGAGQVIEIWTHFGSVHDRDRARVEPTLLVLTTADGRGVDWVARGQYRLTDNPEVSLASSDPSAP